MFADDALLYKAIRSSNDLQDLQMNVDVFTKWIDEHDLRLNVKKCKSLLLSRRQEPLSTYTIRVNDHPIENVQSYKYLGVIISSDLSWGNHVSIVCLPMKHMVMLYRCFYRGCTPDTLRTLYISCVRPLLEYAEPVWDPHLVKDIHALESLQ